MLNKKTNIIAVIYMLFVLCFTFNFVSAEIMPRAEETVETNDNVEGIFDTVATEGVYKYSDNKISSYLPFIRFATDRIIIDKEITRTGFNFSTKTIEVNSATKGLQIMFSSDSIRINAPMEYGVLMSNGNITIDSNIEKTLVLIATGSITVSENANISEDLICVCDNLEVKGTVNGSILGSVEKANISGRINNDLRVNTNNITFSSNDNVGKNVYISTFNKDLTVKEQYPNALLKINEVKKVNNFSFDKIFSMIITSLLFTLIYVVINRISKKKAFSYFLDNVKNNALTIVLGGTVILLAFLPISFLLIILSIFRLWVIAIPILLVYIVFIIIVYMLAIFIVGSIMYTYIKEKYLKESGVGTDILGLICMFLVLTVLTKIPVIGGYVALAIYILAIGIVFSVIFKRKKSNA